MEMVMDQIDFIFSMKPQDFLSALAQLLLSLGVFGNMLLSWHNGRKIKEVRDATNGMKDDLIATTAKAAESKGREDERREARKRGDERENH